MKRQVLIMLLCISACVHAATPGTDSVSSAFFRDWYQTTDLGHYLDNGSPYVAYETETTGEWNLGDQAVFSIAGNSFRQTKYRLNGMRTDSRTQPGDSYLHYGMDRTSLVLDYHNGVLNFTDDSVQQASVRLTGNAGGIGGIAPGTKQLINLFHRSAEERTIDSRPMEMRNHIIGAGTAETAFGIRAYGKQYYQHLYLHYGQRQLTAFDRTGISGMYNAPYYTAQMDGQIPLCPNVAMDELHYFLLAKGRTDYGSEFYYNRNEQARQQMYQAGLYAAKTFANNGKLVYGVSYEINQLKHDSLSFSRNIIDQDGEAFEPWYADGRLHSVNFSLQYDQPLLRWLRVHAEGYNSILHFHPTTGTWTNAIHAQSIADASPTNLYTYHWQSRAFTSGILENEALVIAEHSPAPGLQLYGHVGVSLDGVVLGQRKSVVSPNWIAKFMLDYQPIWWFKFGLSVSHHRMSYTWNEVQYLSSDYLSGEAKSNHTPARNLWAHQPSYAVIDIPVYFTFGKSRRHEIAVLSTYRTYYNQWFTRLSEGQEKGPYTITTQPLNLLSKQPGTLTPYYISNLIRYTYAGRKWFVQLSWQSYLMSGFSTLGNGPLHNNLGSLSESTADPNTFTATSEGDKPYQANGRLNQDRAYIARLQVTYNACRYFSLGLNFKFKDGQPFTTFKAVEQTTDGRTTIAVIPTDARGINPVNNHFGKRKDAFFNLELRATGRWWANGIPMSLEVLCYNIYDFGTELTEYAFDGYSAIPGRTAMSLCIPRGLLFTLRVGLEKDK